jgi:hypothetical protein
MARGPQSVLRIWPVAFLPLTKHTGGIIPIEQ